MILPKQFLENSTIQKERPEKTISGSLNQFIS